ncbi:hypothetical protein MUG84_26535 [Paenibacillus sp. KQZ6P-2]|uniref:Uncharacterized protein n=1 Tax=Paenibacillus mangrovi TaxID=2931978 RepID=A0A9X1WWM1_9BACL|nr:hypothetical protein [Paenibacillus mangrovi]MCJ8015230.1 hypothetical protein [Paenibacillus mangrovi]
MRIFQFAGMMRKYFRPYISVRPGASSGHDEYGDGVNADSKRTTLRGHIQPLDAKLTQAEGGRYTAEDKALYTISKHDAGDLIEYQGVQYIVDNPEVREYNDINKYVLKKVIANDPVQ